MILQGKSIRVRKTRTWTEKQKTGNKANNTSCTVCNTTCHFNCNDTVETIYLCKAFHT